MQLQHQTRELLTTVREKLNELKSKDASLDEVWRLARRVKDNARKELKKVEREKLSYEATPRRTPQRGARGYKTRALHADQSVHLLRSEVAATEAFSQAEDECSQACRAHNISKLQVHCSCVNVDSACIDIIHEGVLTALIPGLNGTAALLHLSLVIMPTSFFDSRCTSGRRNFTGLRGSAGFFGTLSMWRKGMHHGVGKLWCVAIAY